MKPSMTDTSRRRDLRREGANKFLHHLGKFKMHWMGPFEVIYVTDGGYVQLKDLKGK
jgi:hypothetical protein